MAEFRDKYWLFVAELDPAVEDDERFAPLVEQWNPGRDDSQPRAYVGFTARSHPTVKFPDGDFSESRASILKRYGRGIRDDDFCRANRADKGSILRQLERTIAVLRGKGWTVLNPPPAQDHYVYVLELDREAADTKKARELNPDADPELPCVYVGQSSLTPEERLERHLAGVRSSSSTVHEHFKRMLPALYQHLNPLTERESLEKEEELARELRACGYTVIWS